MLQNIQNHQSKEYLTGKEASAVCRSFLDEVAIFDMWGAWDEGHVLVSLLLLFIGFVTPFIFLLDNYYKSEYKFKAAIQ